MTASDIAAEPAPTADAAGGATATGSAATGAATASGTPVEYRVLARKYRPRTFAELIGQDALVRTLTNAIETGRLAHAFLLTGVRGVGKTSTARIIARALNCTGPDGSGGPTPAPCGVCENCRMIVEDRHVDVLEMDAASRTGVNDIREIIEGVRYRPVGARFKIYIIDEVHMLSTSAFNALLKTLEEPPAHVKFIFATTELRKVPVTVLSRCQRFDLKRVEPEVLSAHFSRIAGIEGAEIDDAAMALIARAADGSVRDGLSLLDQAIAHGAGRVTEHQVRDMLGLADRAIVVDLLDRTLSGDVAAALAIMDDQARAGADPAVIVEDMLALVHLMTRVKLAGAEGKGPVLTAAERDAAHRIAQRLGMAHLGRAWQMLLKGLGEVRLAPVPQAAAEMVVIRLAHAADLPDPAELARMLKDAGTGGPAGGGSGGPPPRPSPAAGASQAPTPAAPDRRPPEPPRAAPSPRPIEAPRPVEISRPIETSRPVEAPKPAPAAPKPVPAPKSGPTTRSEPTTRPEPAAEPEQLLPDEIRTRLDRWREIIDLLRRHREIRIVPELRAAAHVAEITVTAAERRLVLAFEPGTDGGLATKLQDLLSRIDDAPWQVLAAGALNDPALAAAARATPTLVQYDEMRNRRMLALARRHPMVEAVFAAFPGATLEAVTPIFAAGTAAEQGSGQTEIERLDAEMFDGLFDEEAYGAGDEDAAGADYDARFGDF
ncbi:DNA polymerase III subunit gamma/tau [Tistrella mobilis]|uniref:DNA polymerase III subunit gamma/tau n=1 Tax=Tistrella mobilis TaxID=171437 RepID=UPI003557D7A2